MRRLSFNLYYIILGLSLMSFVPLNKSKSKRGPKIRNIIFMIGDGMGLSAAYAAMSVSDHPLNLLQCNILKMPRGPLYT